MSGIDEARKTAEKLKKEVKVEKEKEIVAIAELKQNLAKIQTDPELMKMYQESAQVGSENLGTGFPILKVHTVGKSFSNELVDGSEPEDGYFFYQPKQIQFKEVFAHILTTSRGFYAEGMEVEKSTGKKKLVWNQLIGGVITNEGLNYPFISYVTGKKLQPMWDFGKEAGKYTHAKPVGIPMFTLMVKMTNTKEVNNFGKSWVTRYEIIKDSEGSPILVGDAGEFQFLRDMVEVLKDTIEKMISSKAVDEPENIQKLKSVDVVEEVKPVKENPDLF